MSYVLSCYHQIHNIGQIRSSCIADDACKTLVNSLVTARLYKANSLLYGLSQTTQQRSLSEQNCAVRCLSFEKIRPHHSSAATFTLVPCLCALDVQSACVCLLGDASPSAVLSRRTTDTKSVKLAAEICDFDGIDGTCFPDGRSLTGVAVLPLERPLCVDWTAGECQDGRNTATKFKTLHKTHLS